jgi:glycerol kinase
LIEAMAIDVGERPAMLRIDGGMTANDWLCQMIADILQMPVERAAELESTALGAALLAGITIGLWEGPSAAAALHRQVDRFEPRMPRTQRDGLLAGWHAALRRTLQRA